MNLIKSFNLNYAKQNIKKSRGVLALFLGILPIFNTLSLFLMAKENDYLYSLEELSILNMVLFCIIPIAVSICLFGYIYKKKSVDFICSMPISRKTVYITNTIVGIFLLIGMNLVTSILILLVTLTSNLIIPFSMIIDYFLIWSLAYIFVFIMTNLCMSISGNAITQLVLTIIVLAVIPFTHDYMVNYRNHHSYIGAVQVECKNNKCKPITYECYDNKECIQNKQDGIYKIHNVEIIKNTNYPFPYQFTKWLSEDINLLEKSSVIQMIVLSIGGAVIGFYLFKNRKMENNETSFQNYKVHLLVKGITLIPILIFTFEIFHAGDSLLAELIILALLFAYYLIYELITRKGIYQFKTNIFAFCFTLLIGYGSLFVVYLINESNNQYSFNATDIESVEFSSINKVTLGENSNLKTINRNIIQKVIKYSLTTYNVNDTYSLRVTLNTKNHHQIKYDLFCSKSDYEDIINDIEKSADYIHYKKLDFDKIYAISTPFENVYWKADSKIKNIIKEAVDKYSYDYDGKNNDNYYGYIKFYIYDNGKKYTYEIPTGLTQDLYQYVSTMVEKENEKVAVSIDNEVNAYISFDHISQLDFINVREEVHITNLLQNELHRFINNHRYDTFIMTDNPDDYVVLRLNYSTFNYFRSNAKDEIIKMIENKRNEIKDMPEYQELIGDTDDND